MPENNPKNGRIQEKKLDEFVKTATIRLENKIKELEIAKAGLEEKVKERTQELQDKLEELEKFQRLAVGREIKMVELKDEIAKLEEKIQKLKVKRE